MNFVVEVKDLKEALTTADTLLGGITHSNCQITADKKSLTLFSSDSNSCWLTVNIPATVKDKGSFSTEVTVLKALKFSGKDIEFSKKKDTLNFKCGRSKGELATIDNDDIKEAPIKVKLTKKFSVSVFKHLIDSMGYDSDVIEVIDVKPITIMSDGKTLKAAMNDRYCLGYVAVEHEKLDKFTIVLPRDVLVKLASHVDSDFEFGIEKDFLRIKTDKIDLTHSFVQPESVDTLDYDKVISSIKKEKENASVTIKASEVNKVLDEVSSFAENLVDTKVDLDFDKKAKTCNAKLTASYGKFESYFDLQNIDKSTKVKASMYLFQEFLSKTQGDVNIRLFDNKIVITDKTQNFVMPTIG